jgi:replication factor A1
VKSGFDGRPVINLSSNSHIEALQEHNPSIPDIEAITLNVDDVHESRENVVITGIVGSSPSISQYQNPRGEISKLLRLQLSNEMKTRSLRAVIWNIDESRMPRIFDIDAKVRLVGVKIRQGNPKYGSNDLEIHGDEGTAVEVLGSDKEIEARTLKLVSFGRELGNGNIACIALARNGKFVRLIIGSALLSSPLPYDSMIECVPSRILGNSIILSEEDSYVRIIDEDPSFPKISMFESKIRDIQMSDSPYILEAIVLQSPNITEVNTKNGELVNVSDTLIGDDTAEIRLVGWREESHTISRLTVGDRIRVLGARANQGMGGKLELALRPESSLIKVS